MLTRHDNHLFNGFGGSDEECNQKTKIIFLMVLEGVMRNVTRKPTGVPFGLTDRLEEFNFADDLFTMA